MCCAATIARRPAGVLAGFGNADADADALQRALRVTTVRDLALYPPFLAAQELLAAAYTPDRLPGFDPEAPDELMPKVGPHMAAHLGSTSTNLLSGGSKTTCVPALHCFATASLPYHQALLVIISKSSVHTCGRTCQAAEFITLAR
jgi:hypothetical protein